MRKGAILSVLVYFEIPNNRGKENYGRFHEEVALLLHPCFVEVEHYRVGTLVSVRNILHEVGVYGVAPVASSRVIEVDYVEFRLYLIPVQMIYQVVVSDCREVCKLEIVDIHRVTLLNLLLYV